MKRYNTSPASANRSSAQAWSEGNEPPGYLAPVMALQQLLRRRTSFSASVNDKNMMASVEGRSNCLLASAAETKLPEAVTTFASDQASVLGLLQQLELPANPQPPRVAVKAKGKIFFMEIADIVAVHAEGNYAALEYRSRPYLLRECLCSIAVKLQPYGFIRIHRSVLVNASLVDEVWPSSTGEYRLRVRDGKEYVVTRRYKDSLRQLAYVWLGAGPLS